MATDRGSPLLKPLNEPAPDTPALEELLREIRALEGAVANWEESQQRTVRALRGAVEALHGEALRRLIRTLQQQPEARLLLREAAADEVVYAVLRHLGILRASLHEQIEAALEGVRPMLAQHGGNVELVSVTPPDTVTLRLLGACDGCPASSITLSQGVEQAIRQACPEITQIRTASGGALNTGADDVQPVRMVSPFESADAWLDTDRDPQQGAPLEAFTVGDSELLLVRLSAGLRCFENSCAHLGLALDHGLLDGDRLICPHHGFEYEVDEGQCLTVPELCLHKVPLRVEDGVVQVYLP